jgi:hypothetical protein
MRYWDEITCASISSSFHVGGIVLGDVRAQREVFLEFWSHGRKSAVRRRILKMNNKDTMRLLP